MLKTNFSVKDQAEKTKNLFKFIEQLEALKKKAKNGDSDSSSDETDEEDVYLPADDFKVIIIYFIKYLILKFINHNH